MLPKERVKAAFQKKPTDKVPIYQSGFSSRVASAILGREAYVGGGMQQYREVKALLAGPDAHAEFLERSKQDAIDVCMALELDLVRALYWRMNQKPDKEIDEVTFLWGDPDGEHTVRRFDPETELFSVVDTQPPPEPITLEDLQRQVDAMEQGVASYEPRADQHKDLAWAIHQVGDTHAISGYGTGCGIPYKQTIWLEAIALRPDLVGRYLDVTAQRACRTIPVIAGLGTPYLHGGGDFASNRGPFYSPDAFRELMVPALQKISACCDAHDAYHMFATDGNVWSLADELFEQSGIHCFYELDRRAGMEPELLRQRYPKVTLMGGINSYTLSRGPIDAIREEARTAIETGHKYSGMIVGVSNQIVANTPPEHLDAMMDELHKRR